MCDFQHDFVRRVLTLRGLMLQNTVGLERLTVLGTLCSPNECLIPSSMLVLSGAGSHAYYRVQGWPCLGMKVCHYGSGWRAIVEAL